MTELCARYGITTKTGYKWLPRFAEYGRAGLADRSHAPHHCPHRITRLHGLSQLNVWWMRLGITHQRIRPARPQENGCHERMHKTLKYEATRPPERTRVAQQRRFATFQAEYNTERPHEALGGKPPGACYRSSPRPYPAKLPALEYPGHFLMKPVTAAGTFRFKHNSSSLRRP